MNYSNVHQISQDYGEARDCAVRAVTLATGVPYARVHATMGRMGRRNRCGARFSHIEGTVKALGFEMKEIPHRANIVRKITAELQSGSFLVLVSGHILCVKDGSVQDWTDGRAHRVKKVFEIRQIGAASPVEAQPEPVLHFRPSVKPAVKPARRMVGVKAIIHSVADQMWQEAGSPTDKRDVLRLRKSIMNMLELKHSVNRNTASTELGNWQKGLPLV